LGHHIEHKINKLVKYSEKQFLLLKWLVAFNEEFIPNILFTSLLEKNEEVFKEKNENVHLFLPSCDFLDFLDGLKEIGFISSCSLYFGFYFNGDDEDNDDGDDYIKINYLSEIQDFMNKKYSSDMQLLQEKLINSLNAAFDDASNSTMFYYAGVNFVEHFKPMNKSMLDLSDICLNMATICELFSDKQYQLFYLKKSLNLVNEYSKISTENVSDIKERIYQIKASLGKYYYANGNNKHEVKISIEYFKDVLSELLSDFMINQKLNEEDKTNIISSYMNLGLAYESVSDFKNAEFYYANALLNYENAKHPDTLLYVNLLNNISLLYKRLLKYNLALKYIEKALDVNDESDDDKAQSYTIKGNCLHALEQYDQVIKCYDAANEIYERLNPPRYPNIQIFNLYTFYAEHYLDLGDMRKSEEFKEKAKLISKNIHNCKIGDAYLKSFDAANDQDKGEISDMIKNLEKCNNIVNIFGEENKNINNILNLGRIAYLAGNKEKSIVFYYRALELSYRNNDISNRILTLI
jgi:tetratricopeptide (TPR) repeat protein